MKRRAKIIALAAIALACVYGVARVLNMAGGKGAGKAGEEGVRAVPRVAVRAVEKGDLAREIRVTGQIAPLAEVAVIPKVTGRLEQFRLPSGKLIEEGNPVSAGQVIAVIEHAALDAAVKQAEAALEVARVARADADREKKRWEALFAEKSATEQQRDKAMTAFQLAQAQVVLAEATLQQARVMLDETTIEAPIAGIISRKFMDEGNMAGPGKPLVNIVDIDMVKVLAAVSERHITALRPGETPVLAEVDAFPGVVFSGTLHRVGIALDPVTLTAEVEARLPNPGQRLKPGMFARTTILLEQRAGVLIVPEHALVRADGGIFAYVVDGTTVRKRAVKLGLDQGAMHEVLAGLAAGEQIVVRGQRNIRDGDVVEPQAGEEPR